MAKSLFPEEMMNVNNALTLESIAGKLTFFHEQLHLLHWQTNSYATHMCLGSLYDYVHDFKDSLIEKLMGYTGHRPSVFKIDPLTNAAPINVVTDLMLFAGELKKYGEVNNYHDVCNLADSLSGEAAKTKYLLTLS